MLAKHEEEEEGRRRVRTPCPSVRSFFSASFCSSLTQFDDEAGKAIEGSGTARKIGIGGHLYLCWPEREREEEEEEGGEGSSQINASTGKEIYRSNLGLNRGKKRGEKKEEKEKRFIPFFSFQSFQLLAISLSLSFSFLFHFHCIKRPFAPPPPSSSFDGF